MFQLFTEREGKQGQWMQRRQRRNLDKLDSQEEKL